MVACCEECVAGVEHKCITVSMAKSWGACCCKTGGTIRIGWLYTEGLRECKNRGHDEDCCVRCDLNRKAGEYDFGEFCCCKSFVAEKLTGRQDHE